MENNRKYLFKKNKFRIIIIIVIILIMSAPFIFATTDYTLAKNGFEMIFSKYDGGIKCGIQTYKGLGYIILKYDAPLGIPDEDGKEAIYHDVKIYTTFSYNKLTNYNTEEYNTKYNELKNKLNEKRLTKLKKLPQKYTLEQAIKDKCLVSVEGKKIYNKDKLDELDKLKGWEDFVRCVEYSKNGDIKIIDVYFDSTYFDFSRVKNKDNKENDYSYVQRWIYS